MNMDSVNKWLTLAANFGVLAGIVFLGIELQQNSLSTQAQTRTELTVIAHEMIQFNLTLGYFEAENKANEGLLLTPYEESLLTLKAVSQLRTGENVFYQHRVGTFDDDEFGGYENYYRGYLSNPFNRKIWKAFTFLGLIIPTS
ncbi:MAG: hypothetical protein P8M72_06605 [Gammaproteobacteria bacterium]|nr:hypothetical protein [Gammaproteobacteria bacterium]